MLNRYNLLLRLHIARRGCHTQNDCSYKPLIHKYPEKVHSHTTISFARLASKKCGFSVSCAPNSAIYHRLVIHRGQLLCDTSRRQVLNFAVLRGLFQNIRPVSELLLHGLAKPRAPGSCSRRMDLADTLILSDNIFPASTGHLCGQLGRRCRTTRLLLQNCALLRVPVSASWPDARWLLYHPRLHDCANLPSWLQNSFLLKIQVAVNRCSSI